MSIRYWLPEVRGQSSKDDMAAVIAAMDPLIAAVDTPSPPWNNSGAMIGLACGGSKTAGKGVSRAGSERTIRGHPGPHGVQVVRLSR